MNHMQRIIMAAAILLASFACTARAEIQDAQTLELTQPSAAALRVFQKNRKVYLWTVKQNGAKVNLTGYTPFMFIAPSNTHGSIVTSACAIATATNGTFTATWTPAMLNTNGTWIYGVGYTDANGDTTARQGVFVLTPDPFASGADPMTFSTNTTINMALYAWNNSPFVATNDASYLLGVTNLTVTYSTSNSLTRSGRIYSMVLNTNYGTGGAGGVVTWTAGTGQTNSGTATNPTGDLNAASQSSLALADTAIQQAALTATGAQAIVTSTNLADIAAAARDAALLIVATNLAHQLGIAYTDGATNAQWTALTNWVAGQNYVTVTVTNGLATVAYSESLRFQIATAGWHVQNGGTFDGSVTFSNAVDAGTTAAGGYFTGEFKGGAAGSTNAVTPNGLVNLASLLGELGAADATNAAAIAAAQATLSTHSTHLTTLDSRATYLERNDLLTWVELQIQDSLTRMPLADGYRDYFTDQSGINLVLSSNQTWASGYYSWSVRTEPQPVDGLQVQYHLDDNAASTAVVDSGPSNRTGAAAQNTSITTVSGKLDAAYQGNGVSDHITITGYKGVTGSGARTVSVWVKLTNGAPGSVASICSMGADTSGLLWHIAIDTDPTSLGLTGGKFIIHANPGYAEATNAAVGTGWHHIVATFDGVDQSIIYVDGVLHGTLVQAMNTSAANDMQVGGAAAPGWSIDFPGAIDEFRVYSTAVTPATVAALYASGVGTSNEVQTAGSGGNMALVATNSGASPLDFTPTEGRLGVWLQTNSGPITQNSDLAGYLARDDAGTNWQPVTFDGSAQYSTNASDVLWWSTVTNLPGSGSNFLWKLESLDTNTAARVKGAIPQAR